MLSWTNADDIIPNASVTNVNAKNAMTPMLSRTMVKGKSKITWFRAELQAAAAVKKYTVTVAEDGEKCGLRVEWSAYEEKQKRKEFVCMPTVVAAFSNVGEEQQKAAEEARENLKKLEVGLEGKRFFGGDNIGFADIAIGWLPYWIGIVEEVVAINLIDA
ncbi:hypothetical protein HN51_063564, partial [Arachis hypogaea]